MIRITYEAEFPTLADRREKVVLEAAGNWDAAAAHGIVDRLDAMITGGKPAARQVIHLALRRGGGTACGVQGPGEIATDALPSVTCTACRLGLPPDYAD